MSDWAEPTYFEDYELGESLFYDDEMDKYQQEALAEIKKVVATNFIKDFAEVLASSFINGDKAAESIATLLGLEQAHFEALLEDKTAFKECLQHKNEQNKIFYYGT